MNDTIGPMPRIDRQHLAKRPVEKAEEEGDNLVGPDGVLTGLTKNALESALDAERSEHLGHDKHDPMGRNRESSRNGTRVKAVQTEVGAGRD